MKCLQEKRSEIYEAGKIDFVASARQLSRKLYHAFSAKRLQNNYFSEKLPVKTTKITLSSSKIYLAVIRVNSIQFRVNLSGDVWL